MSASEPAGEDSEAGPEDGERLLAVGTTDLDVRIVNYGYQSDADAALALLTPAAINAELRLAQMTDATIVSSGEVGTTTTTTVKTPSSSSSNSNSEAGCFPSGATVEVEGVGRVRVDAVRVGDRVLTSRGFRPVLYFGHADPRARGAMVRASTAAGGTVWATPDHDVVLAGPRREVDPAVVVSMGELAVGTLVWAAAPAHAPDSAMLEATAVTSVELVAAAYEAGYFSPFTDSYDVVVDGVLMSCGTAAWRGRAAAGVRAAMWAASWLPDAWLTGTAGLLRFLDEFARRPDNLAATGGRTLWVARLAVDGVSSAALPAAPTATVIAITATAVTAAAAVARASAPKWRPLWADVSILSG
mmetsp:Transcript_59386/g.158006  ORF Transcript_59386/g.158006 Transcript_59386/m.158006 type:complete len:358 (-) Transcript_59386:214-1287(-)